MNPFHLDGKKISLDTWRWLYLRQHEEIKAPPNKVGFRHLNTLVRHDLLVYRRGRFHLTDISREVLLRANQFDKELNEGVPISYRTTRVRRGILQEEGWVRGKTQEKKPFYTNNEIVIFSLIFSRRYPYLPEIPLELELLISQVRKTIYAEGYLDVFPRILQRRTFFEPGIIWFKGTLGEPVGIKEEYYDLIIQSASNSIVEPSFAKVSLEKDYVVVINPYRPNRYFEDIYAIIQSHTLEGLNTCMM